MEKTYISYVQESWGFLVLMDELCFTKILGCWDPRWINSISIFKKMTEGVLEMLMKVTNMSKHKIGDTRV